MSIGESLRKAMAPPLAMSSRRIGIALAFLRREPFWSLLYNHCRVLWVQARQPGGLSPSFFWMTNRYLRPYIGCSLTHDTRRNIVILQAEYLRERLRRAFFLELEQPRQALWRDPAGRRYSIWLSANSSRHLEGDFDLNFKHNDIAIYALSFSIGPNLANPAADDAAMLIGRVQGGRGRLEDIRLATKTLKDISPAALLVSAAEGIALALNLSDICGVSGSEQTSRLRRGAEYFDYDSFWESLSGRRNGGWYQFDAPFQHKPTSQLATYHRRRARRRRLFRDALREEVRVAFVARFARQSALSATAADAIPKWARLTGQRLVESAGLIASFALTTFYWSWPADFIPDETRYGRVDDVAIALAWAILSFRVVSAWREPSR